MSPPVRLRLFRIQFWIPYRGSVDVFLALEGLCPSAQEIGRSCLKVALHLFNTQWPGARLTEVHCTGAEAIPAVPHELGRRSGFVHYRAKVRLA